MDIPTAMQSCNNLHGKKGDLGDVEVLVPQHSMYVVKDNGTISVIFQVEVLLGYPHNEILHA
jgi:hypothetical protein